MWPLLLVAVASVALVAASRSKPKLGAPGLLGALKPKCAEPAPIMMGSPKAFPTGYFKIASVKGFISEKNPGPFHLAHPMPFPAGTAYECSPVSTRRIFNKQSIPKQVRDAWGWKEIPGAGPVDEYGRSYGGGSVGIIETFRRGAEISGIPGLTDLAKFTGTAWDFLGGVAQSPLWDMAATGAYFVPGAGPAVSAGMAAASAIGRGESFQDVALAGARGFIPPGAPTVGFDVGVAFVKGDKPEADIAAARLAVEGQLGPEAAAAFDTGVRKARER